MKSLQEFFRNFFLNKGQHVFLSLLIAKICAFAGALFIIRFLPTNEFGIISIVAAVFAIFAPFSGFGSQQILLRYGAITPEITEKKELSRYLLMKGFGYQFLLSILFLIISLFYLTKYEDIFLVFLFFAFRLLGIYFLNHIQSEFRVLGNNSCFAKITNVTNVCGLVFLLVLSYFFGLMGYLIAMAASPFLALFWFKRAHFQTLTQNFSFSKKEIWSYGLHASGSALLSDALFSADILILSFLTSETAVADYKAAILIPANITFLALTFMQSDFPVLAKNYQNKVFLRDYIHNYYKIFIPVVLLIFTVGFIFKRDILHLFFSHNYAGNSDLFIVLLGAFCVNMMMRNLYGNLLSAVGKMKINTAVSLFNLLLLILFSSVLVLEFGVLGMAVSLGLSMGIGGFLLMFSFYSYYKNLK